MLKMIKDYSQRILSATDEVKDDCFRIKWKSDVRDKYNGSFKGSAAWKDNIGSLTSKGLIASALEIETPFILDSSGVKAVKSFYRINLMSGLINPKQCLDTDARKDDYSLEKSLQSNSLVYSFNEMPLELPRITWKSKVYENQDCTATSYREIRQTPDGWIVGDVVEKYRTLPWRVIYKDQHFDINSFDVHAIEIITEETLKQIKMHNESVGRTKSQGFDKIEDLEDSLF
jgi:hypothetical protein